LGSTEIGYTALVRGARRHTPSDRVRPSHLVAVDDDRQVLAFLEALKEVAGRMGGVTLLSAAVACAATFGPLETMTAWQRRAVNRALAPYRVRLEFPELNPQTAG
jgi:hypothetical protein